jgi:predicted GH43/DUF377 family glycosyl hydrolase
VECVLNPGVFRFAGKIWLLLRVAERPIQQEGVVSFPVLKEDGAIEVLTFKKEEVDLSDPRMIGHNGEKYLSTISHLRLVCSEDGQSFNEPADFPSRLFGQGKLETYGIEDCRVSFLEGEYCLTYTQVSENGVGVGLMRTRDWRDIRREGMILPPHNKDCALFEEKIEDKYFCFHRPSGQGPGGNFVWIASSPDLLHWGGHHCILHTRNGWWDSARVGAGAAPIKTKEGWLMIYHGANEEHRYCLGAALLDLKDPSKVLARSHLPLMEPDSFYEQKGFFGNVIFTNGHLVDGDKVTMYYGASDEVICGATLSVQEILADILTIV